MSHLSRRRVLLSTASALTFGALIARGTHAAIPISAARGAGWRIQCFGDSISSTSQGTYSPSNVSLSNIPAWTASTVVPAGYQVQSAGLIFYTSAGGTTGSVAPTPSILNDGGVTWVYNIAISSKPLTGYLTWAEIYSGGLLNWDMTTGYGGVGYATLKCVVNGWGVSGGAGYLSSDTPAFTNGGTGTITVGAGGTITAVNILSPGFGGAVCTINTSTGSGASIFCTQGGTGTLGCPGNSTTQMRIRLADAIACPVDIMVVLGGTNDVDGGTPASTTIANLQYMVERLMDAGKRVVLMTVPPNNVMTTLQSATCSQINQWIRAYCRGETWANPSGYRAIALADPAGFWEDGTNQTKFYPVGGAGGTSGAVTFDGLHPSPTGAEFMGYCVWQAAQQWLSLPPVRQDSIYSALDGYDPLYNPSGNLLEGLPWQASTVYAPGSICANGGGNTYYCKSVTGNAQSAASGGPTGTGGNITDGNVVWSYTNHVSGISNFSSGTSGTQNAATGIVYSGSLATGYTIGRTSGSASGTVACSIENPWSDGQTGQRQALTFTLGSGTASEAWYLILSNLPNASWGFTSADLGVTPFYIECEMVVSGIANCCGPLLRMLGDRCQMLAGATASGAGFHILPSTGVQIAAYPNNGIIKLRSQPMVLHSLNTYILPRLDFYFDASGSVGSATLTVKLNQIAMRRYGVD